MHRQQPIDQLLLAAHRLAMVRLREAPERVEAVPAQPARWRMPSRPTRSDACWGLRRMTRRPLEHVLRAAPAIAQENSRLTVGSQAVWPMVPNAPAELLLSREIDLSPPSHPERADLMDGAVGALSSFDETFGYDADGVGPETAVMPGDWMDHASLHSIGNVTAVCPNVHDLAISKRVAGRDPVGAVLAWARRRAAEAFTS